jgi:hypothetical protein
MYKTCLILQLLAVLIWKVDFTRLELTFVSITVVQASIVDIQCGYHSVSLANFSYV